MFLGCEAVLTLVPQSGLNDPASGGGPVVSMDDALALEDDMASTRNDEEAIDMGREEAPYGAAVSTSTRRTSTKPAKRAIVVTMVHGDILVLSGDKFEVCAGVFRILLSKSLNLFPSILSNVTGLVSVSLLSFFSACILIQFLFQY